MTNLPNDQVWNEYSAMDRAVADIPRAIFDSDNARLIADLDAIAKHRNRLVNRLQTWNPELRIAADE